MAVRSVPRTRAFDTIDNQPPVESGDAPAGAVGGGWVGYLGYGLTDPGLWPQRRELPDAAWGWSDHVVRCDAEGQWWLEALIGGERGRRAAELDELFAELSQIVAGTDPPVRPWRAGAMTVPSVDDHLKAVRGCVDQIAAGEIFQANIASRFVARFDGDPVEVFAAGSASLRPARAAYVSGGWGAVVSLSPELFLARHGDVVRSSPIKGTLPRRGPEDDGNAERLRASTKDVAENVMIVDMARNDLGRVAEIGRVSVPRLLDVQAHPGVWHLVSDVRAELPPGTPDSELLAAAFPPASVTGAPKVRALEVIAELEAVPRQVYCGAVGMSSPVAGTELNVAIRSLEYSRATEQRPGLLRFGVGGGITADSDPDAEWQECLTKAAPLLSLLGTSVR